MPGAGSGAQPDYPRDAIGFDGLRIVHLFCSLAPTASPSQRGWPTRFIEFGSVGISSSVRFLFPTASQQLYHQLNNRLVAWTLRTAQRLMDWAAICLRCYLANPSALTATRFKFPCSIHRCLDGTAFVCRLVYAVSSELERISFLALHTHTDTHIQTPTPLSCATSSNLAYGQFILSRSTY